MNAIEIKNLKKQFGNKTAVDGISFHVEEGCLFSLLGVNGAGKTTTIRILCGLSKPTEGELSMLGYVLPAGQEKVKNLINLSPQDTAVAPNLTVRENLQFISGIYGYPKDVSTKKTEEIILRFGLEKEANTQAKTLSGGWQRRLSIAMALITEPKVLFLDEPTLGLDVLARRELWKIIESLKGKITIILTTHYMEEAEALSDQVAIMADGHILAIGTTVELMSQTGSKNLEEAFISIVEGKQEVQHED